LLSLGYTRRGCEDCCETLTDFRKAVRIEAFEEVREKVLKLYPATLALEGEINAAINKLIAGED